MQLTEAHARMSGSSTEPAAGQGERKRQVVCFTIGAQNFGIDIGAVREIRAWSTPTALPHAPEFVRGVINLRGTIVPIIDLRARFALGQTEPSKAHVVIIVQVGQQIAGLLVDTVTDIAKVTAADVRDVPDIGGTAAKECLAGLIASGDRMIALVSAERIAAAALVQ